MNVPCVFCVLLCVGALRCKHTDVMCVVVLLFVCDGLYVSLLLLRDVRAFLVTTLLVWCFVFVLFVCLCSCAVVVVCTVHVCVDFIPVWSYCFVCCNA